MSSNNEAENIVWCTNLNAWKTQVDIGSREVTFLIQQGLTKGEECFDVARRLRVYLAEYEAQLRQMAAHDAYETDAGLLYSDDGMQLDQAGVVEILRLETVVIGYGQSDTEGRLGWICELYYDLGGAMLDHQVVVYLDDRFHVIGIGRSG